MAVTTPRTRIIARYGRRADLPDPRDHQFEHTHAGLMAMELPAHIDLRDTTFFAPVFDQLACGSCVSQAVAAAYSYEQRKAGLRQYTPARLFLYYCAREIENTVASDCGCEIRNGIKVLAALGAPHESLWPYDISKVRVLPPPRAYLDGAGHDALHYSRIDNSGDDRALAAALAAGVPVVIGISVGESFESDAVARTGTVPIPTQDEHILGGHCMLAIGYDTTPQGRTYLVRNSWGPLWGDIGHCYIPAAYLIDTGLAGDFWTIQLVS
jgi:C1A family cysteine protease